MRKKQNLIVVALVALTLAGCASGAEPVEAPSGPELLESEEGRYEVYDLGRTPYTSYPWMGAAVEHFPAAGIWRLCTIVEVDRGGGVSCETIDESTARRLISR